MIFTVADDRRNLKRFNHPILCSKKKKNHPINSHAPMSTLISSSIFLIYKCKFINMFC